MGADPALARLEIDLSAIAANWRALGVLHPSGPVAGVVKADAYGLGATLVAPALFGAGCRHFFTAHLTEAIAIRPLVAGAMVAVLNGLPAGSEDGFVAHGVLPVLGTPGEVARWAGLARRLGRRLPALLHVDTGMNRLGLHATQFAELADDPRRLDGIDVRYVMTHLVSSETADDPLNEVQRERFAAIGARLPGVARSFANSSGIFLGAGWASDLARPGAALYGINPTPGVANPMRGVVRLSARVLALREVRGGDSVGYNSAWVAARDSRIATVGVGYADGWLRSHSGHGHAVFDGAPLPLVGRVSMDLTTFDATDAPSLREGDMIELIGPARTVDAVAEAGGTNGYEVLIGLGRRYGRVYRA